MSSSRSAGLAAVLLLAGCARTKESSPPPAENIEGFTMAETLGGRLNWTLKAERAEIDEGQNAALLTEPRLEFYKTGRASARIDSHRGVLDTLTHDIALSSAVVAHSLADRRTLWTEHLNYSSKRQKVFTDDPVRIESPDASVEGRGLETDPEFSVIKLKEQRTRLHGGGHGS